jgi:hypothetical protein
VLISVAAGAGLTVVAAVDLDVQRLPQDHLPLVAHSITGMITAMAARDQALLGPCNGGLVAFVGFERPQHGALGFREVKPDALLEPPQR